MTRRDWWMGIAILVAALMLHGLVVVRSSRTPKIAEGPQLKPLSVVAATVN